ncbi:MAG: protein translocase subunit SecF [Actinobacteria bacterium]|nr:protein translocase subunit SecF [Actinomycetota bacterium]
MSKLGRLNRGETNIDFLKWWKIGLAVSVFFMVVSVGSLLTRGLNLGIDFKGGVSWEVSAPGVTVDQTRTALDAVGEGSAKIQIVGTDIIRVQGPESTPAHTIEVTKTLAELANTDPANISFSTVGASWGGDVTRSAIRALVFFFIAILIYLTIRLEWRMAVAALVAVFHDVLISVGAYSVFQFEVTPGTVIAFLTILGYSIYDTIVVDDKIRENERLVGQSGRLTYGQMTSLSMNQVLLRSINTTVVSLLPVVALLVVGAGIMGAVTLEEFAIALTVGLLAGAYSSIFVAAPILVWLKEHQSKFKVIRERLQSQGVDVAHASARVDLLGVTSGAPAIDAPSTASATAAGATALSTNSTPSGIIPPRPRKNQRKR